MSSPTTVYQYFAANGALLYVGITNRGVRRSHEHGDTKSWWTLATGCTLEHYADRSAALEREAYLIATFRPPYNKQHNPESGKKIDERRAAIGAPPPESVVSGSATANVSELVLQQRRRDWYAMTADEKKRTPCIRCQSRPGWRGPECLNCFQSKHSKNEQYAGQKP